MAKEDYNVADRDEVLTAGERVAESVQATPDADAATFAGTNNVSNAAYANYATALAAHAARDDIESLADRRAREVGDDFADADFMRRAAYDANGDAVAPPRPGTVEGDAPASA